MFDAHTTVKSLDHLNELRKNPYTMGEFLFNERGEVFLVEEADELLEEISSGQINYSINWESEIWSESGISIPAVYTE